VLAAVADEEDVDLAELGLAVRATKLAGVGLGRLVERSRLPVSALDRPRDEVLEATEDGAPLAGGLVGAEPVVGLDIDPAPAAPFGYQRIG
jgi:hypothetical protein